jgi:hypothetical protein
MPDDGTRVLKPATAEAPATLDEAWQERSNKAVEPPGQSVRNANINRHCKVRCGPKRNAPGHGPIVGRDRRRLVGRERPQVLGDKSSGERMRQFLQR